MCAPRLRIVVVLITHLGIVALSSAVGWAQSDEHHTVETLTVDELGPYQPENAADSEVVSHLIIEQTNQFRQSEGLAKLGDNEVLAKTALKFAQYMAHTDRYGHTADGRRPSERAQEQGYEYCQVAENIAYFFATEGFETRELAEDAVTSWKNSPGHRENMLKPYVTETGVGIAQSKKTGTYYAVQLFGRPKSAMIEFTIANKSKADLDYQLGEQQYSLPPSYRRQHEICLPIELKGSAEETGTIPASGNHYQIVPQDGKSKIVLESESPPLK